MPSLRAEGEALSSLTFWINSAKAYLIIEDYEIASSQNSLLAMTNRYFLD